ncbi:hypothetical protein C8R45DRAFT_1086295 [Mycena sanguinolenta]|nr:hypothetical protein C8R45DRAFT_1086295 [Mycena sanguinolenta]
MANPVPAPTAPAASVHTVSPKSYDAATAALYSTKPGIGLATKISMAFPLLVFVGVPLDDTVMGWRLLALRLITLAVLAVSLSFSTRGNIWAWCYARILGPSFIGAAIGASLGFVAGSLVFYTIAYTCQVIPKHLGMWGYFFVWIELPSRLETSL